MPDDVILNKIATIERCLARLREEYREDSARLDNQTVEDAIVLNLQRACEAAIDLAMRIVARERLGIPQDSRHGFTLLEEAGELSPDLADRMRRMVGFRNIAIHDDTKLSRPILESILSERLRDFEDLCGILIGKGSRKNNFPFSRPDLGQIWSIRLSETAGVAGYVEDFAIEDRPKMARRWDAKMGSYSCAGPKS